MTLRNRLMTLFVTVILLVSMTIGLYAVITSARHSRAELNQSLNALVASAGAKPNHALTRTVVALQRSDINIAAYVISKGAAVVTLHGSMPELGVLPSYAQALGALSEIKPVPGAADFSMRSINAGGSSLLVLVEPTASVRNNAINLGKSVGLFAFLAAFLGAVAVQVLTRRDLKTVEELIGFAEDVSENREHQNRVSTPKSSDVVTLKTSLDRMVAVLQDRLETVEQTNMRMQQFIGDASHELRTPLTTIRGYSELLEESIEGEAQVRAITRISQESRRMSSLIDDLLLLAELGEPTERNYQRMSLSQCVLERSGTFVLDNPLRGVSTEIDSQVWIQGQPKLIERLLDNAFSNIVRHTAATDDVGISLQSHETFAVLCIEDAGPGLAQYGESTHRFRRFDNARSRETGGSGLGLSIMHDIVLAMLGTFSLGPSELGGLKIQIALPIS